MLKNIGFKPPHGKQFSSKTLIRKKKLSHFIMIPTVLFF